MAVVGGWIWETNLDGDALAGALDATDADTPDAWFDYPSWAVCREHARL